MAFLVKNFGNNTRCCDVTELKAALLTKYQGKSVTVLETLSSGVNHTHFVDVKKDGKMTDSHTGNIFDFNKLG